MTRRSACREHVGIAMGGGAEVSVHSASVSLVGDDIHGVLRALLLGRAAMRNVRQNPAFAFGYNALRLRDADLDGTAANADASA